MFGRTLSQVRIARALTATLCGLALALWLPAVAAAVCGDDDLQFGLVDEQTRRPVACVEPGDAARLQVLGPDLLPHPLCVVESSDFSLVGTVSGDQQCLGAAEGDQIFRISVSPFLGGDQALTGQATCSDGATSFSFPRCGTIASTPGCVTPPAPRVAWFPFDEGPAASTFDDLASSVAAHIAEGSPTATVGVVGDGTDGALSFDGVDDLVAVPDRDNLDLMFGPFTVHAWIKTTDSEGAIVGKRHQLQNGNFRDWVLMVHQNRLWLRTNTRNYSAVADVTDGAWHHVAAVFDPSSPTASGLFVDGVEVSIFDATRMVSPLRHPSALQIGGLLTAEPTLGRHFFRGKIDEVTIHGGALTDAEVAALAQAGPLGQCKPAAAPGPSASISCTGDVNDPELRTCEADVVGGTAPFLYLWSGAGDGSFTVDANDPARVTVDTGAACGTLDGAYTLTLDLRDASGQDDVETRTFRCGDR
ncbi:MAG: LamG domain-containing protein [Acidobacteriota bacterium]